jgi:hypothetical protein
MKIEEEDEKEDEDDFQVSPSGAGSLPTALRPVSYCSMISTMFSVSIRTASDSPKKKTIWQSLGAPNSRGVLNVYCAPLLSRIEKGRNGWRSAKSLMSATFIVVKLAKPGRLAK